MKNESNAPSLIIATTNLKIKLDEALFRRFDDVIEFPLPQQEERDALLRMTLSAIPVSANVDFSSLAEKLDGYSYANIVLIAQRASKNSVLEGNKHVDNRHFEQAIKDGSKF